MLGDGEARSEGLEVAVVDADERRVEDKRAGKLGLVMHLGENAHAEIARGASQIARRRVVDRRHDDEDAVGAPRPGLEHLIGVHHKVLAQRRKLCRLTRRRQIFRAPLEGRRIGEHRETGGAPCRVGARQARRIEISPDQAFRWACLLDLGDERKVAGRDA